MIGHQAITMFVVKYIDWTDTGWKKTKFNTYQGIYGIYYKPPKLRTVKNVH